MELLYNKITWWTKSLTIYSVIFNAISKKYLMYYLDIISIICFLIGCDPFVLYMVYVLIQYYSTNNSKNSKTINDNKK